MRQLQCGRNLHRGSLCTMKGLNQPSSFYINVFLFFSFLVGFGCQKETGILLSVSGSSVEELKFLVGIVQGENTILDRTASGNRFDVRSRNLSSSPYEHILHQPDNQATPLTVQVLVI